MAGWIGEEQGYWQADANGQYFWVDGNGQPAAPPPGAPPAPTDHIATPTFQGANFGSGRVGFTTNQAAPAREGDYTDYSALDSPVYKKAASPQLPGAQAAVQNPAVENNWAARQDALTNNMRLGATPASNPNQAFQRYGQPTTANTQRAATPDINQQNDQWNLGTLDIYSQGYANANQRNADLYGQVQRQNGLIDQAQGAWAANDQARFNNTQTANQNDFNWLREYEGQVASTNASNNQYMSDLNSQYGQLNRQLVAQGYGADVQSDPQSMAMQNQAWGQLQGAANGSLDYQSQAARAYADAQYVQQQQDAYQRLNGMGNGSLDIAFDPVLRGKQNEALEQYNQWRTPELTAQEEFMKEQARYEQEQQETASRQAVADKYARQGLGGSGMELQMAAQNGQQFAYERLIRDLGANANAVARAERSLAGYAGLSTDMQNQDTSLKQFNANTRLNASGMASDAARGLRQDDFNEEYARGVGADNASANNQRTRLGGMQSSAQLATDMRSQADSMSQFNKSQRMIQQRFQDDYAASERDAQWGRTMDRTNMGIGTNQTNLGNNTTLLGTRQETGDRTWARSDGTLKDSDISWGTRVGGGQTQLANNTGWTNMANGTDSAWLPVIGQQRNNIASDRLGAAYGNPNYLLDPNGNVTTGGRRP